MEDLVAKLGCRVGNLLSTYLGMPLGAPLTIEMVWDRLEERF